MEFLWFLGISFCFLGFSGSVMGKECTNSPTQISSHTAQYDLSRSKNQSLINEVNSYYDHLIPTYDAQWLKFYRSVKDGVDLNKQSNGKGKFLREVSLHDVRLDAGSIHGQAQQTNLEYLLMLDVDNLVWSFRKTAGLPTTGMPYGGWEAPDVQLRGHFVGHYLSASAHMWASTGNGPLYQRMSALVSILGQCQKTMGTGYLSAFPEQAFDQLEAIKHIWAPYYTIHKIMAGLLDQYLLASNTEALQIVVWMADYFNKRVQNVISKYSLERHWLTLNTESGGMNDVLYKLYSITGEHEHLVLAHLFDKPCFLGVLAVQADSLSGFHTNTHIPLVIGAQMRYEVTGDPLYKAIGIFFMDIVNSSHCYATGGTSVDEFWSDPKRLAATLGTENEESCTTYNMLKVSRNLFRWSREMAYADYYERAITNGVLSIQRGREAGIMIYMLPLGRGVSKAQTYHGWGTKFDSFWCCYGTGIESFSKLGDSIYFEEEANIPGLYVIQYISSSFNWRAGQMILNQKVEPLISSDPYLRLSFTFSNQKVLSQSSTLYLRIPLWMQSYGAKATINGQDLHIPLPGNFMSITKKWNSNDKLMIQLPINLRTEAIQDDQSKYSSVKAILFGPYLLAGLSDGDWDIKTGTAGSFSDWITAVPATYNSQLISLTQEIGSATLALTNTNDSIMMQKLPGFGTDAANHATFRFIIKDQSSRKVSSLKDLIGTSIILEPFDLPGMALVQQGQNNGLVIASTGTSANLRNTFRVLTGLDGKGDTISLESESESGCFLYSELREGGRVKIECKPGNSSMDAGFRHAVSFTFNKGIAQYHPISFIARGAKRNFVLMPLLSLTDESYTVYFNMEA